MYSGFGSHCPECVEKLDEAFVIATRIGHQKLLEKVRENRERLCA